jgi:ribosomal protein S18 acetylase RimI-like enzyme
MSRRLYGTLMHQVAKRGRLHVLRVFRRELGWPARCPAPPGLELRALSQAELLSRCRDPELDLREAMIQEALRRGDLCLGALDGGTLLGYVWFAYQTAPHVDGVWVKVPPHAVYRFKSFVRPTFRGRGIAAALYGVADAVVARPGLDSVVDCVAVQNPASIAATLKSGSRPLGAIAYWQASRWFVAFHSRSVRRLGLRFYHP